MKKEDDDSKLNFMLCRMPDYVDPGPKRKPKPLNTLTRARNDATKWDGHSQFTSGQCCKDALCKLLTDDPKMPALQAAIKLDVSESYVYTLRKRLRDEGLIQTVKHIRARHEGP